MNLYKDESGKFTTNRDEPLTANLNIRVSPSMRDKVKAIPNYPEKLREVIQQWLENLDSTEQDES
ncbi:hypothetical protein DSM106972_084990 [Dulcicalothrix desertica PCC 7102]|uniref:Uncharacterized protein n=2 Tax=Dulcicalothrix desertica TaxID=32056 RepID=A0A3S1BZA4_9CYAN|nr:hypothetical protein DSM106972_084990 [Dulcicalothrix desertica PCC 7102]TWH55573.1 hypothetical protein CAL7102_03721 [Dulcicalothrix desertica PCC 7102]